MNVSVNVRDAGPLVETQVSRVLRAGRIVFLFCEALLSAGCSGGFGRFGGWSRLVPGSETSLWNG